MVNDYELVVSGLESLLTQYPDLVTVRDAVIVGEPILDGPVDVALYDTYGRRGLAAEALEWLVSSDSVRHVAVFSLGLVPALIEEGRQIGVSGFISKALPGKKVAEAIVEVAAGREVVAVDLTTRPALDELEWPGKEEGLTERESQVLVLMAEGLTNPEIAAALYLSVETIKGHVSKVLRKLGLRNRNQASGYVARATSFSRRQVRAPTMERSRPPTPER